MAASLPISRPMEAPSKKDRLRARADRTILICILSEMHNTFLCNSDFMHVCLLQLISE